MGTVIWNESTPAIDSIDSRIMLGTGGFISAIKGAVMVAMRAEKLHTPAAVAQKSVGKSFCIDK